MRFKHIFFLFLLTITIISSSLIVFEYQIPMIGGCAVVHVLSASMTASGIKPDDYDLIIRTENYEVGDIIAFKKGDTIWMHQIEEITDEGMYITKGTSNAIVDNEPITYHQIIGKYICPLNFLRSVYVRLILVLIPYILIMLLLSIELINTVYKEKPKMGEV